MAVVDHGNQGHGPAMHDDLAVGDRPVGQPDRLERQVDLATPIDHSARWQWLGFGHEKAAPQSLGLASRLLSRIVRTGQGASRTIRSATDPSSTWLSPVRPWVAITIRSMACSFA